MAWGNSIGDYMANTSIAKKGFAEMALTGCYAAPLFNLVLGLGLSTFKTNLLADHPIYCHSSDPERRIPLIILIGTTQILMVTLIWTSCWNKFKITKGQGYMNFVLYALVLILILKTAHSIS
jgi:sodium/potassium/calcium exchanger 6